MEIQNGMGLLVEYLALSDGADRVERSGTLARGLTILQVVAQAPQPLSLAEIATAASLDQSTTHRLLKTLEETQYVVKIGATRRYCASPNLLHPLPLLHPLDQLRREAAPALKELSLRLRLTTILVVFVGAERLVLDIALVPGSLTPYYSTWLKGPMHATAGGKALLVGMTEAQRASLIGLGPFDACTPQTLTDSRALNDDLQRSAARGYVVSHDEHRQGVTNLSAPISRWTGGAAGCLIASSPSSDIDDERIAAVGLELKRASELLVYQAPSLEAASRFCGH